MRTSPATGYGARAKERTRFVGSSPSKPLTIATPRRCGTGPTRRPSSPFAR
ncbi:hypothetical protein ACFQX7_31485 [Luedemannella flava]